MSVAFSESSKFKYLSNQDHSKIILMHFVEFVVVCIDNLR